MRPCYLQVVVGAVVGDENACFGVEFPAGGTVRGTGGKISCGDITREGVLFIEGIRGQVAVLQVRPELVCCIFCRGCIAVYIAIAGHLICETLHGLGCICSRVAFIIIFTGKGIVVLMLVKMNGMAEDSEVGLQGVELGVFTADGYLGHDDGGQDPQEDDDDEDLDQGESAVFYGFFHFSL